MNARSRIRSVARWSAAGVGFAAGAYAVYAGVAWHRYGRPAHPQSPEEEDPLLDRFMPVYEVVERHHIRVAAPAEMTFAAAREMDLFGQPVVGAIFRARELLLEIRRGDLVRLEQRFPER